MHRHSSARFTSRHRQLAQQEHRAVLRVQLLQEVLRTTIMLLTATLKSFNIIGSHFSKKNERITKERQVERKMVSEKVTIVNPSGLHLLNAVNLSNSVSRYKSSMSFTYENNGMQGTVNLKSILSIVAAGIKQGETIEICSSGEDEEEALRAAVAAIKSGLGETPE